MDAETAVENFVSRCWDKVSKSAEFVYVVQVPSLVSEFELRLNTKDLLKKVEKTLLKEMIHNTPTLKLHKKELDGFFLKISGSVDMVRFFTERTGLSRSNLVSILNKPNQIRVPLSPRPELKPEVPVRRESREPLREPLRDSRREFTPREFRTPRDPLSRTHLNTPRKIPSPPSPERSFRPASSGIELVKERQVNERDEYIGLINKETRELKQTNEDQLRRIRQLEASNKTLKSYVESLELELKQAKLTNSTLGSDAPQDMIVKDLINQCNERDKTIKMLEGMCEQYQNEFTKLKDDSVINDLMTNINEQNQLISDLKTKMSLNKETGDFDRFIARVPILKQYLMFYRYKEQTKSVGMVLLNAVLLVGSFYTVLSLLRVVYFIVLSVISGRDTTFDYVYEDYGPWTDERVSMTWWKELDWLEYGLYSLFD